MGEATRRFFEELDRRGYEPLLAKASGTVRFDCTEGAQSEHWSVVIDRGNVKVVRDDRQADTIVRSSQALFDELFTGREQSIAALLRGDVTVAGDMRLVLQLERIFPGPADSRGPKRVQRREVHV